MITRHKILRHAREVATRHGSLGRFCCVNDDDLGYTYVADFIRTSGYVVVEIGYLGDRNVNWQYEMSPDGGFGVTLGYNLIVRPGTTRTYMGEEPGKTK